MTPSPPSPETIRRLPTRRTDAIANKLAIALTFALVFAPSIAQASYQDGAWGFIVCLFLVPAALIAILVTAILRAGGAFESPTFAYVIRCLMCIAALVPLGIVLTANDMASTAMVLTVDALALAIIFRQTRSPANATKKPDLSADTRTDANSDSDTATDRKSDADK